MGGGGVTLLSSDRDTVGDMCSNYEPVNDKTVLLQHFGVVMEDKASWPPETWPVLQAPVVRCPEGTSVGREIFLGQFGLLPHWAKDPTLARRTYNARAETAHERLYFKDAWRKGFRCVIPAQAIYETRWDEGKPVRWRISRVDGSPLVIAGLWSRWWAHNGAEVMSFAMLTVDASEHPLMKTFNKADDDKRMVALLDLSQIDAWLGSAADDMLPLLQPCDAALLQAEPAPLPPKAAVPSLGQLVRSVT
jgi:putative SOS response-associated peptidase YedK